MQSDLLQGRNSKSVVPGTTWIRLFAQDSFSASTTMSGASCRCCFLHCVLPAWSIKCIWELLGICWIWWRMLMRLPNRPRLLRGELPFAKSQDRTHTSAQPGFQNSLHVVFRLCRRAACERGDRITDGLWMCAFELALLPRCRVTFCKGA